MDQYGRIKTVIVLSCCMLAGCAWLNPKPTEFVALDAAQSHHLLKQIASETNGLRIAKCRGNISLTVVKGDEQETKKADMIIRKSSIMPVCNPIPLVNY